LSQFDDSQHHTHSGIMYQRNAAKFKNSPCCNMEIETMHGILTYEVRKLHSKRVCERSRKSKERTLQSKAVHHGGKLIQLWNKQIDLGAL
jgi:predicted MarR family transcription regulator